VCVCVCVYVCVSKCGAHMSTCVPIMLVVIQEPKGYCHTICTRLCRNEEWY